jgi:hypothetical protein
MNKPGVLATGLLLAKSRYFPAFVVNQWFSGFKVAAARQILS